MCVALLFRGKATKSDPGRRVLARACLSALALPLAAPAMADDGNDEYDFTAGYRFSAERWPAWACPFWIRAHGTHRERTRRYD